MPSFNLQHGRLKLKSGDTVPLEKIIDIDNGDMTWTEGQPLAPVLQRGRLDHLRRGPDEMITWSFSAKFKDETLRRTIRDFIWDAQAELLAGLTGGAVNNDVTTTYPFEQDSLQPAASETAFSKIANGGTPSSDGEIAENIGTADKESVVSVAAFDVQMPAADTDLNVTYDAIGKSTLDPTGSTRPSDVKTLDLVLEKLQVDDLTTVVKTFTLRHARFTSIPQEEGEEFDTISFEGIAFSTKAIIT